MIIQSIGGLWLLRLLGGHTRLTFALISFVHNAFLIVWRSPEPDMEDIFTNRTSPGTRPADVCCNGINCAWAIIWGKQRCQFRNRSLRTFLRCAGSRVLLSGSQESGDAYVVALLEALVENPSIFPANIDPKIALYQIFLKIWNSVDANAFPNFKSEKSDSVRGLQTLTPKPRQAFLLLSVEGFDADAIANDS